MQDDLIRRRAERETGQWIDTGEDDEWYGRIFKCSLCGKAMIGETNCCPGCGKKMEQTPESRIYKEITEAAETILGFFDKRFTDSVRTSDRVIVEDWKRFRTELARIYQIDREEVKEWLT